MFWSLSQEVIFFQNWLMSSIRSILPSSGEKGVPGSPSELQNMLPSSVKVHRLSNAAKPPEDNGGICLMTESPFRILRVREMNTGAFQLISARSEVLIDCEN
jgi:hypothetical protein